MPKIGLLVLGWLAILWPQWVCAGSGLPMRHGENLPPGTPLIQNFHTSDFGAAPQNWDIAQDSRGVMYFANASGVLMFDGTTWKLISKKDKLMPRSVAVDKNGVVYVGAMAREFGYFASDREGNWVYQSLATKLKKPDRNFADIWSIHPSSHGVYFMTYRLIFRWHAGKVEVVSNQYDIQAFSVGDDIYVYSVDGGISLLRDGKLFRLYHAEDFAIHNVGRLVITSYEKNMLLIATQKSGFYLGRIETSKNTQTGLKLSLEKFPTQADAYLLENGLYYRIAQTRSGLYAFLSRNNGLILMDKPGKKVKILNENYGLLANYTTSVFIDRDENLWVTSLLGISHINISSPWTRFNTTGEIKTYIPEIARHQRTLYAGSLQGLFCLPPHEINPKNDKNPFLHVHGTNNNSFSMLSVNESFFAADHDKLCLVQDARVQKCINIESNRIIHAMTWSKKLPEHLILSIVMKGLWWVRMDWMKEMVVDRSLRRDPGAEGLSRNVGSLNSQEISNDYFINLSVDDRGDIWASTRNQGIVHVTLRDSDVREVLVARYGVQHGLPSNDNNRALWIANRLLVATDQGVYRMKVNKGHGEKDIVFEPDPAFPAHMGGVWQLLEYGKDFVADTQSGAGFLRTGPDGIYTWNDVAFRVIPVTGRYFKNWMVEEDGVIWVSNNNEVYRFDPNVEKSYQTDYQPVIRIVSSKSGKQIFGGRYHQKAPERKDGLFTKLIEQQPDWMIPVLAYENNSISFEYGVPFYEQLTANQVAVRLEGFEENWNPWSPAGKKEYTNLPEGSYRFVAKAKNLYGHESKITTYRFVVLPPWYRTIYAYCAYGVFFVLIVYTSIRINGRRLLAAKKRLEKIVRLRTETIRDQNDMLEHQNEQLQMKNDEISQAYTKLKSTQNQLLDASWRAGMADVASNVLHNVGNVLCSVNVSKNFIHDHMSQSKMHQLQKTIEVIKSPLDLEPKSKRGKLAMDYLSRLAEVLNQEHTTYIEEIQRLEKGLEQINSIIQAQQKYTETAGLEEELTPGELIHMAVEMSRVSNQDEIKLMYDYQYHGVIRVERHKVIQILINLINHAKLSLEKSNKLPKTIQIITKEIDPDRMHIEIRDNGAGMDAKTISRIFTFDAEEISHPHSLDLHASANAAKSIRGRLEAFSEGLGMGSSFALELRRPKEVLQDV